jgi:hypothetical protein
MQKNGSSPTKITKLTQNNNQLTRSWSPSVQMRIIERNRNSIEVEQTPPHFSPSRKRFLHLHSKERYAKPDPVVLKERIELIKLS